MTNRIIKLRAWDKERNVMLPDSEITRDTNGVWEIWDENDNSKDDNFVLMQFTGLLDKNSKEIYDGDIVVNKNEPCKECGENKKNYDAVSWNEQGYWQIGFGNHLAYNVSNVSKGNIKEKYDYLEVIGNIYENPDLYEKTKPKN